MHSNVQDLLESKVNQMWTINADETVYMALVKMAKKDIGALVVMEEEKVVGIFSERDYARKVVLYGKSSKDTAVRELMTKEVTYIKPDTPMEEAMALMSKKHIRHLPVIDEDKMVGMVTIRDVLNKIISDQQDTIKNLEDYIYGRSYGTQVEPG
jgi:signal-transduction protein with cAMP-binding, CBS, and nucleotidyltransferase domain